MVSLKTSKLALQINNNIISHCNLYLINYKPINKLNIYSFNLKVITCYKSHFIEIISYVAFCTSKTVQKKLKYHLSKNTNLL